MNIEEKFANDGNSIPLMIFFFNMDIKKTDYWWKYVHHMLTLKGAHNISPATGEFSDHYFILQKSRTI